MLLINLKIEVVTMIKKLNFSLILLLLIILSIGAVSASPDINSTDIDNNIISDNQISEVQDINMSLKYSNNEAILNSNIYSISSSNYNNYFDSEGKIRPGGISNGDTVNLEGTFTNKNFIIDRPLNLIGTSTTLINNGTFLILAGGSGTNISGMNIVNCKENTCGIFISGVQNCNVKNNHITCSGVSSFPIALNTNANYNNVINNTIISKKISLQGNTKSTSGLVVGGANHNYIANNYIQTDDANGLYLSHFGSGSFEGGLSHYNYIFNNTLKCNVIPTSWAYAIQMMGSHNKAESNKVYCYYRGISASSGSNNTIINNYLINLTGIDFNNGELVGGDYAIHASPDSLIANNTISGSRLVGAGIYAVDNCLVTNNNVEVIGTGYGIDANGNNVNILNNNIKTEFGAVVYQMGKYVGLVTSYNTITSNSGVGVLIKKQSNLKFPSNIAITHNTISTGNEYAINAADANKSSFIIKHNTITSESIIITPNGTIDPSEPVFEFNGTIYNVTTGNYSLFFDNNGNMINLNVKNGDILNFIGEFNSKKMLITSCIKITGTNATFYNSTFVITASGVWIEKLKIYNLDSNSVNKWGIYIKGVSKIMVTNNEINVSDSAAAYAIYVLDSGNVQILNNKLYSRGNYLTYTLLAYEVYDSVFKNNTINTVGTGQVHTWESEKCIDGEHNVKEIYRTYGILMLYSSDNKVLNNNVHVSSLINQSLIANSTNSLVGIDIYFDSDNNIISNNVIVVEAKDNYLYGFGVIGAPTTSGSTTQFSKNNNFLNNNVTVIGNYFVTGFISGFNSLNTNVLSNIINVKSDNFAYGITLEASQSSVISNNKINISSIIGYVIEGFASSNNIIKNNDLYGIGSYIYGIALYKASNSLITNNNIVALGDSSKNSTFKNFDVIETGNSGIYLKSVSSNNTVYSNNITTLGEYTVNMDVKAINNSITFNYLSAKVKYGDNSVNNSQNNTVHDNYKFYFDDVSFPPISITYMGGGVLSVNTSVNGAIVKFYVNGVYIGSSMVKNGIASLNYNSNLNPNNYVCSIIISYKDYKTAMINSTLTINKGHLVIDVENTTGKPNTAVIITTTVVDSFNNPISNLVLDIYRDNIYIGQSKTNEKGISTFIYDIPKGLAKKVYSINVKVAESSNYLNGTGTGYLTVNNQVQTILTGNDIVLFYKNGTRYFVHLTDVRGNPVSNQAVIFKIYGMSYSKITDKEGKASIAINLPSGNYEVSVLFKENENYVGSDVKNYITVLPTIDGKNIVKIYKNGTQYYATFVDGLGKPLANRNVTFNIYGVMYTRPTNDRGVARLNINLHPGEYIITAIHPDNGQMFSNNITVLSSITGKNIVKYYRNGTQYYTTFLKNDGTPLTNTKVTFNIYGVMYTRTTNNMGVARLNINLNPGDYIITAIHPENGQMFSNNIKVLPTLLGKDLTKKYGNTAPYEVRLVDGKGLPISGASIRLNIYGVFYNRRTDSNGIARLNINLMPGEYIISAYYNDAVTSNTIKVTN